MPTSESFSQPRPHLRRRSHEPACQAHFSRNYRNRLSQFKENRMIGRNLRRLTAMAGIFLFCATAAFTDEVRHLKLEQAVRLALQQNRALKIARLKVNENESRKAAAHSDYLPTITNQSNVLHISELQNITLPAGSFGSIAGANLPPQSISVDQGKQTLYSRGTMFGQPLTQRLRVRQENRVALAEIATSQDELKNAENQVALQVHTLYFGILVAQLQRQAAEQEASFASESLRENENDVRNGSVLQIAEVQSRAALLQGQQSVLTAELQVQDYMTELNDLLGLSLDTKLELDPEVATSIDTLTKADYIKAAWDGNPEIRAAEEAIAKARAGLGTAKTAYIPDITVFAR